MLNPAETWPLWAVVALCAACNEDATARSAAPRDAAVDADLTDAARPCAEDPACDDDDPCTVDRCVAGDCAYARPDAAFQIVGTLSADAGARGAFVQGDRVFVARGDRGYEAWAVETDAGVPAMQGGRAPVEGEGAFVGILADDQFLYVWHGDMRLTVLARDSGDPVGSYSARDVIKDVALLPRYLYLAVFGKGVEGVDLQDRAAPRRLGRAPTPGRAEGVARRGDEIVVADGLAGLARVDIRQRDRPTPIDTRVTTEGRAVAVDARASIAVLAERGDGLGVVDLEAPGGPVRRATLHFEGDVLDVALLDDHTVAVAAGAAGLKIVDLLDPAAPRVWFEPAPGVACDHVHADGRRLVATMGGSVLVGALRCPEPEVEVDAGAP